MAHTTGSIMLIDDDNVTNYINKALINALYPQADVSIYQEAQKAIDYLGNHPDQLPEVILLDLNMPLMNGWQFLEAYLSLNLDDISLYLLTSSIDTRDKQKSSDYPIIKDFVSKPLDAEKMKSILLPA